MKRLIKSLLRGLLRKSPKKLQSANELCALFFGELIGTQRLKSDIFACSCQTIGKEPETLRER